MVEYLVLDPEIRNWVVLPMVLMIMMVGVGRHYVQQLIKGIAHYSIVFTNNGACTNSLFIETTVY